MHSIFAMAMADGSRLGPEAPFLGHNHKAKNPKCSHYVRETRERGGRGDSFFLKQFEGKVVIALR